MQLLTSGLAESKDFAIWALSLCICEDNQKRVTESGGVPPLIEQLADPRPIVREQASTALGKLAADNNHEARGAVTKQGGIKPLLGMLSEPPSTDPSPDASPSPSPHIGLRPPTREVSSASTTTADWPQEEGEGSAEQGTRSLGDGDPASIPATARRGVHQPRTTRTAHDAVLEAASFALSNLAVDPAARDDMVANGGVALIVQLLRKRSRAPSHTHAALTCVCAFVHACPCMAPLCPS